jgi:outer membrane protein OmpA-like peptidoglycan-associated protein
MQRRFLFLFGFLLVNNLLAQTSSQAIYNDGHGGFVYAPNGKISFADVLVEFQEGNPKASVNGGAPEIVLGESEYNIETRKGFLSLGCGGTLTVRFTDNALVNIEGPDLYIFEVGSEIEPTQLEISKDGITWINVGEISGGRSEVDINNFVKENEAFYYVRLTDLKGGCKGSWPGADIAAVAALGSVMQVTLNSSLLFDVGSYTLKPDALLSIDSLANKLNSSSIKSIDVFGHTDNAGGDELNMTLSKNRANAVKDALLKKLSDKSIVINTTGFGKTQPIATNDTEEGRQANRRVSLVIYPKAINKVDKKQFEELSNVTYVLFDYANGRFFNNYPKPVNAVNFSGLYTQHIDEALFYAGTTYFFNGNKVKKYNNKSKLVDPAEQTIKEVFPGVGFNQIDAAYYLAEDDMICFFKNDSCMMYRPSNKSAKAFKLENLFPGLPTTHVEAILFMDSDHLIFFFDGMTQVYNYSTKEAEGQPVSMTKANWGNLWLDGPDAIMDDNSGMVYFFKSPAE